MTLSTFCDVPTINIYIYCAPQTNSYYMNPYNQHMVPDPSSNNIFQFQNPMILQQQFYQQPNMVNFNQQYPQNGFQFGFNVMSYSNLNNNLEEEEKKKEVKSPQKIS